MKITTITFLFVLAAIAGLAQSTPKYEYAVVQGQGTDWNIYYEDSTRQIENEVDFNNVNFYPQLFKLLHYMNARGYELINSDIYSSRGVWGWSYTYYTYYFKRVKKQ